ncbi:MAG: RagB/SusD family nutrient uptake outer membrane protein, partial [Muribaculaceae bacterium]|nr:RagB/SusD family nutrient uptake outer membrane protein [Muribaculaceae bacterium]
DKGDLVIHQQLDKAISCQRFVTETSSSWSWSALRNINFYLEHSSNCTDEAARKRYDGVARFFRASFYFTRMKNYGEVPWYSTVLDSDDPGLYKPRDSRETVMQNIIADLDYAVDNLPKDRKLYEVTRWTALALKSRVCLYEGTWRKYHGLNDWEKYLNLCAEASDELMRTSGYSIYNSGTQPYRDLFRSLHAIADEVILAREYDGSMNIRHLAQTNVYNPGTANFGVTQRLAKIYLMKDGTRFTDQSGWATMEFKDETKNRDPRMEQTLCLPGFSRNGVKELPNLRLCHLGYQQIKYVVDDKMYDANGSDVDLPIYRYAEVLLNYAEAKAELGTLTQDDINRSIKLLRDRVKMPNLDMTTANANPDPQLEGAALGYPNVDKGANKGVILEIRRERTIEMIFEGQRYDDLMRWKEGAAVNQPFRGMYFPGTGEYDLDGDGVNDIFIHNGTGSSNCAVKLRLGEDIHLEHGTYGNTVVHTAIVRNWNEIRDYLYFIPSKERVLNPSLTQNPGWNDGLGY